MPVRIQKARRNKKIKPGSDSISTEKALIKLAGEGGKALVLAAYSPIWEPAIHGHADRCPIHSVV
jgi:hypothetical protein